MLYPSLFLAAVILAVASYKAVNGNSYARDFLWVWAIVLCVLVPFMDTIGQQMSAPAIVLVATTTIPYLLRLFSRRSQALEETQSELRRVLAESAKRTDDERRRIARRLHDDINPRLVLAKLDLQHLGDIAITDIEDAEAREKAQELVKRTLDTMGTIYQEIREVIKNTRIEMIDSIGLLAALESLIQHYQSAMERPEIVFQTNLKTAPKLPEAMATSVYRMIQEALLNAVKHADATKIGVKFECIKGQYRVEVSDNGKGMSGRAGQGIGLIDLRERAKLLGAELKISSTRGKGTTVSFAFADQGQSDQT